MWVRKVKVTDIILFGCHTYKKVVSIALTQEYIDRCAKICQRHPSTVLYLK
jgi:hypothetical protein